MPPMRYFPCGLCEDDHLIRECPQFLDKSVSQRINVIWRLKYCHNCLAQSHELKNCQSENRCSKCGGLHHTMLHHPALHGEQRSSLPRERMVRDARDVLRRRSSSHSGETNTRRSSSQNGASTVRQSSRQGASTDRRPSHHRVVTRRRVASNQRISRPEHPEAQTPATILSEAIRLLARLQRTLH